MTIDCKILYEIFVTEPFFSGFARPSACRTARSAPRIGEGKAWNCDTRYGLMLKCIGFYSCYTLDYKTVFRYRTRRCRGVIRSEGPRCPVV